MAASDTAKLIASLELKDAFSKPLSNAGRALAGFDAKLSQTEGRAFKAGQQIGTGIKNGLKIATVAVGLLATQVFAGLNQLVKLESATAQTNAALKSTAAVSGQTTESIRKLAEKYENLNAVIDDKVIQSGANVLLTFTNIRKNAFEPALAAALDLSVGMGQDLQQSIVQVGKALNDPLKGMTALQKIGVAFTVAQKEQIKELVGTGNALKDLGVAHVDLTTEQKAFVKGLGAGVSGLQAAEKGEIKLTAAQRVLLSGIEDGSGLMKAQQIILKELGVEFGGRFTAQGKTAEGTIAGIGDAVEDLQKGLATALFPTVQRLLPRFRDALASPAFASAVSNLGDKIAALFSESNIQEGTRALESLFRMAKDAAPALQNAAEITGRVIGEAVRLFKSLPPEIQSLAVAGLAINKLTGGLVTNLAGGLISAVISSFKGLMNVNAGVVNVTGAGGAMPVTPAGAAGWGSLFALIGPAVVLALGLKGVTDITNQEFADKGIKSNFKPPDPGLLGGLGTAFHNIGEILRITQNRDLVNNTSADLRTADRHTGELAGALDNTSADLRTADRHIETLTSAVDRNTAATAGVNRPKTQKAFDFAFKEVMKPGVGVARGGPDKGSTWSSVLTRNFLRSDSVTYRSTANLKSAITELEKEQKSSSGKTAAAIGRDVATLKTELGRRTAEAANKMKAAVEAAARGIGGAVKGLDVAPKVNVNTSLNSTTFLNGRLISANLERFQTVVQGGSGVLHNGAN